MRTRTLVILAIVAVVLAVLAAVSRKAEHSRQRLESGSLFPGADWKAATEIFMATKEDTVLLHKKGGQWLVATEGDYPADTSGISRALGKMKYFDKKYLRSKRRESLVRFELEDTMGTEVRISGPGGSLLAHFRIGKRGPDFSSQYIRLGKTSEVYLIPKHLASAFDVSRPTWRDKTIFKFDHQKVERISVHEEDKGTYTLEKNQEGDFVLVEPESSAVKQDIVKRIARSLADLRCTDFADSVADLAEAGLEPPKAKVTAWLEDGATYALELGGEDERGRIYVRKPGSETIFLIMKGKRNTIVRDLNEIKEEPKEEAEPETSPGSKEKQ